MSLSGLAEEGPLPRSRRPLTSGRLVLQRCSQPVDFRFERLDAFGLLGDERIGVERLGDEFDEEPAGVGQGGDGMAAPPPAPGSAHSGLVCHPGAGLRRSVDVEPEGFGGGLHAGVVGDNPGQVGSELLGGGEMNGVQCPNVFGEQAAGGA